MTGGGRLILGGWDYGEIFQDSRSFLTTTFEVQSKLLIGGYRGDYIRIY